ncbi:hypothetical protein KC340_g14529 [Hortaea werneckii]|nr:hypothetical protein KC342_g14773 [Hortaea werneckii]KAI7066680.1 hypothetical protein KC339_g15470 [Hortaea werneckii]KAI7298102.1 hypothetical protein KC340_g14529 [Hortaea werneckii]KAI7386427.1 hypothetical protein KC328_g9895 [Hortaea werneckii]KAI7473727.1 hypothetical protein KC351_g10959 [Hortaea werneckii]
MSNPSLNQQSQLVHSQAHTSSNHSIQSQLSSRNSDTTQGTSSSTLFPPLPPPPTAPPNAATSGPVSDGNGGLVKATDNIMNSVASASSSLFQICVSLRSRLLLVPAFSPSLLDEERVADEDTDPVTVLWRTFRRGYPLMDLYNALGPEKPLEVGEGVKGEKRGKAATFKFLQACVRELGMEQEECFIVTDLFGDDTTGFVKVARVVNRVLDILASRGLIDGSAQGSGDGSYTPGEDGDSTSASLGGASGGAGAVNKKSQRQHIITELVATERTYVQHLELLQRFKSLVESRGVIPGDSVHSIFLNLNSLLDFQRRFLIRVEQTNALPEDEQNWGRLFVLYCDAFRVYEPYIANQRRCERTVAQEYPKLASAGGDREMIQIVETPATLSSFLMKPFQRLSKYPLLLSDLYKKGDLDEDRKRDLLQGKEAAQSVLERTNAAVDREEKAEAVAELKVRVEDWKGHRVEGFGALLMYGTFTVLKSGDMGTGGKEGKEGGERQYHVYLFETILLCCKDIDLSKPKNKLSNKQLVDKRGKPKLQLKGRIFMQNVTDLVSLAKPGMAGIYFSIRSSERIFWKGDPSIENFIIRFTTEEMMKKWAQQIETQRRRYRETRPGHGHGAGSIGGNAGSRSSDGSRHGGGTSQTEFTFLQNQSFENPYKEDDVDDDEAETLVGSGQPSWAGSTQYVPHDSFSKSRNGSSSSLRSRSTTGTSDGPPPPLSSAASARAPPPRFPPGTMPGQPTQLTLRTQQLQQQSLSPGDRGMESYFSPVGETPISSRTSASSQNGWNQYPFPRQTPPAVGGSGGYYEEGHGATRFTAPAMGGRQQREGSGSGPSNGYAPRGNQGTRGMHSANQMPMQHRNRSASSPDIHAQRNMRNPSGGGGPPPPVPAVPALPGVYQDQATGVPRSQSGSPAMGVNGNAPGRGMTSSPAAGMQRGQSYRVQDPSPTTGYPPSTGAGYDRGYPPTSRSVTPVATGRSGGGGAFSPPPHSANSFSGTTAMSPDLPTPTQLKVKVHCPSASQTLTLVVPLNITCQSLKDRIDAKLQRSTTLSLNSDRNPKDSNQQIVKLKYLDEDDYVSIQSDEDVQTAFETWREQNGGGLAGDAAGMGEIELFCQK